MIRTRTSTVAVVGGSGFIGSALVRHFSKAYKIRVLDLKPPSDFRDKFVTCDIREKASLEKNLQGTDLVINAAVIQIPNINENKRLGFEVNVRGVENLCEVIESIRSVKGLIHTGSWHVFGETSLKGKLDEHFGFHPDYIEERAKFYALTKIAQESIIRIMSEVSDKSYTIFRLGTVLGQGMPPGTAANLFIDSAIIGKPITPYRDTQHRPMLYVDIADVCRAFEVMAKRIVTCKERMNGFTQIVNLFTPPPLTIIDLARTIRSLVIKLSNGKIRPPIRILDRRQKSLYYPRHKRLITADSSKFQQLLGTRLTDPRSTIERLLASRMANTMVNRRAVFGNEEKPHYS